MSLWTPPSPCQQIVSPGLSLVCLGELGAWAPGDVALQGKAEPRREQVDGDEGNPAGAEREDRPARCAGADRPGAAVFDARAQGDGDAAVQGARDCAPGLGAGELEGRSGGSSGYRQAGAD